MRDCNLKTSTLSPEKLLRASLKEHCHSKFGVFWSKLQLFKAPLLTHETTHKPLRRKYQHEGFWTRGALVQFFFLKIKIAPSPIWARRLVVMEETCKILNKQEIIASGNS